jgi:hypothetical protein
MIHVSMEQVGMLTMFCPRRSKSSAYSTAHMAEVTPNKQFRY